ncbi:MAG: LbtU family siderophore porin [Desulfobulbus sp.]
MATQTLRFSVALALGWLTLPFATLPLQARADNGPPAPVRAHIAQKKSNPPPPAAGNVSKAPSTQTHKARKHIRRKKGGANNPFVRLSRRILNNTMICRDEFELSGTMADPGLNGCLAAGQDLQWAFGDGEETPIGFAEHPFVDQGEEGETQLFIQPLHLYLGGYTPLFKQFFTPLGQAIYLSVGDLPQGTDSWLMKRDWLENGRTGPAFEYLFAADSSSDDTPLSYRYSMDRESSVIAGVGWIYDISDATGMSQAFAQAGYDSPAKMSALNLVLGYSYNAFTLTGGYIHAIEERDHLADFSQNGQEDDPTAWSSQLAYSTELLDRPATFAIGYQKSSETLSHYLPEVRYTTKASILLRDRTTLSLEYYQDKEYSSDMTLDDDEAYGITTKLGFQF